MNEQDTEYIEEIAKQMGQMPDTFGASVVIRLWNIIDSLDKQITEIVKSGEPFVQFYNLILYVKDENIALTVPPPDEHTDKVTYKEWSRLAEALKEAKEE